LTNFALIGAAGFVAPRHLQAIQDVGGELVAATDPHDSVGILDRFFPQARYFPEIERFDRHLEKLRRLSESERVDYVVICSPNYLHDAHVRLALRVGAQAICEKPLVIAPWNLDQLAALEQEHGKRVCTILQLRVHPELVALRQRLSSDVSARRHDVELTYVTGRGPWYHASWKGNEERSGGVTMNIGVHFFDLLCWLFGPIEGVEVHVRDSKRAAGVLELERARVRWFLSLDRDDVPEALACAGKMTFRSISVDGEELEFSEGFSKLHTKVYEEILAGRGYGIEDARPSIEAVHRIRTASVRTPEKGQHPLLASLS
jgi:UDP-N-acetyl-2-amino-2-deoxyglucuronate dehydrogenase